MFCQYTANFLYLYKYTHWQEMKIMQNLKTYFFFKIIKFLLTFFQDIIIPVSLSTQIACDVMCVQHVIH